MEESMPARLSSLMRQYHLDVLDLPDPMSVLGKTNEEIYAIIEDIGKKNIEKENQSFKEAIAKENINER